MQNKPKTRIDCVGNDGSGKQFERRTNGRSTKKVNKQRWWWRKRRGKNKRCFYYSRCCRCRFYLLCFFFFILLELKYIHHTSPNAKLWYMRAIATRLSTMPRYACTHTHTHAHEWSHRFTALSCMRAASVVVIKTNKRRRRQRPVFTFVHIQIRRIYESNVSNVLYCGGGGGGSAVRCRLRRIRQPASQRSEVNSTTHKIVSEMQRARQRWDDVSSSSHTIFAGRNGACVHQCVCLRSDNTRSAYAPCVARIIYEKRF